MGANRSGHRRTTKMKRAKRNEVTKLKAAEPKKRTKK
jgi:hypothetical protein